MSQITRWPVELFCQRMSALPSPLKSLFTCGVALVGNWNLPTRVLQVKPLAVAAIGPVLLLHGGGGKCAARNIELIPANSCWTGAILVGTNRTRRPQRFRATAVLVNHRGHDFISQCVHSLCCSILRHDCKT